MINTWNDIDKINKKSIFLFELINWVRIIKSFDDQNSSNVSVLSTQWSKLNSFHLPSESWDNYSKGFWNVER